MEQKIWKIKHIMKKISLFWPHNQCLLKQRTRKGVSTHKPSFRICCCWLSRGKICFIQKSDVISITHLGRNNYDDFSCLVYRRKILKYKAKKDMSCFHLLLSLSLPPSLFLQTFRKYGAWKEVIIACCKICPVINLTITTKNI